MMMVRNRTADAPPGVGTTGTGYPYSYSAPDALGNITSVTTGGGGGTTQNRTYNSENQLTAISGGSTELLYDNNGNMTRDEQGRTYAYDAWNRLIWIQNADHTLMKAFTYDGLGRRATETTGYGTPTDFYYNTRWQLVQEKVGGTVQASYFWSATYIDALLGRTSVADGNYYALHDANFNITTIESPWLNTLEHFAYSAYGTRETFTGNWTVSTTESANWNFGWQGLRWDAAAGLYQARNRWYSPSLMRWSSWDPLGYPDGLNTYLLDAANPINHVDPTGLSYLATDILRIKLRAVVFIKNKNDPKQHGYVSQTLNNDLTTASNWWKEHAGIEFKWDYLWANIDEVGCKAEIKGPLQGAIPGKDGDQKIKDAINEYYSGYPVLLFQAKLKDWWGKEDTHAYTPPDGHGIVFGGVTGADIIAHELGHLFIDSSHDGNDPSNLMFQDQPKKNLFRLPLSQLTLRPKQVGTARTTVMRNSGWTDIDW